jgi:hypothetical protein
MMLKILTILSLIGFSLSALALENNDVTRLNAKAVQLLNQQDSLTAEINELERQVSLLQEKVEFSHLYLSGELNFEYKVKVIMFDRFEPIIDELDALIKANSQSAFRLYFTKLNTEILSLQVNADLIRQQRAELAKELNLTKNQILAAP